MSAPERPPLPRGAGINTIRLEVERTREELADTLDDIFATFNPRVQLRSHPLLAGGLLLVAAAAAGGIAAVLAGRRRRGR